MADKSNCFVMYDDVKFVKSGWIHRNRVKSSKQGEFYISLPLIKSSDYDNIGDKKISTEWPKFKQKLKNKVVNEYRHEEYFDETLDLFLSILDIQSSCLFDFVKESNEILFKYLSIETEIVVSSQIKPNESKLTGEKRLIELIRETGYSHYINLPGGKSLYDSQTFMSEYGIKLDFVDVGVNITKLEDWNLSIFHLLFKLGREKVVELIKS